MTGTPATMTLAKAHDICGNPGKYRDHPTLFELAWAVLKTNRDQPIRQSKIRRVHDTNLPFGDQVTRLRLRLRLIRSPAPNAQLDLQLVHGPTDGDAA